MKNLISFSLYGSHKKYLHGIVEAVVSYKLYFDVHGQSVYMHVSPLKITGLLQFLKIST